MITIPNRLKLALEADQLLFGEVNASLAVFTPWISDNKLIFFPEYTDHGTNHLQEVLNTASSIITDDSWSLISPQDSAAIILSTLLHDCAMHLSEDGFYKLITNDYPMISSRYEEQNISWKDKWMVFLTEARRWDGKKIQLIYGDSIPVKDIPSNKNDLMRRDRLLIGEFLRREHANLAHAIALQGVPFIGGEPLKLKISDHNLCDLIGFVAKSHNMPLRTATDKLGLAQKRSAFNIHAPFVMGILRISDYIQVHSSRADKQLLSVKSLSSPISQGEWNKHHSILDINQTHEDPEALYIDAEPQNPVIFKELKKLFSDIQKELDATWSVIGEVYGRFHPFEKLGINIRRIRSSLDDERRYILEKKPRFIPRPLKFRTSDAEMITLLIAPLYGNNPSIGIRELVQNAVDACNERVDFNEKTGITTHSKNDINVTVKIEIDTDGNSTLCIIDTGIGMTLQIIENYFLNIGASFRNSDKWKEMHETDGHSNVHRTGRFGVGLLAAFLLGKKISVETKHITEQHGLHFTCTQDSEDISVIPVECAVGTKITISLPSDISKKLIGEQVEKNWDWYCLSFPKVNRIIINNNIEKVLDQRVSVPSSGEEITDTKWHRIEHVDFDDILWSLGSEDRMSSIVCNGISLSQRGVYYRPKSTHSPIDIQIIKPDLVVYDQDGKMPINLTRDGLTSEQLPFEKELVRSISLELAREIYSEFYNEKSQLNDELVYRVLNHNLKYVDRTSYIRDSISDLFFFKNKMHPSNLSVIYDLKPGVLFVDAISDIDECNGINYFNQLEPNGLYSFYNIGRRSRSSKTQYLRANFDRNVYTHAFPYCGKRLFIRNDDISDALKPGGFPKSLWSKLSIEWSNEIWSIMKVGNVPELKIHPDKLFNKLSSQNKSMFTCLYIDWEVEHNKPLDSIFAKVWHELISDKRNEFL